MPESAPVSGTPRRKFIEWLASRTLTTWLLSTGVGGLVAAIGIAMVSEIATAAVPRAAWIATAALNASDTVCRINNVIALGEIKIIIISHFHITFVFVVAQKHPPRLRMRTAPNPAIFGQGHRFTCCGYGEGQ